MISADSRAGRCNGRIGVSSSRARRRGARPISSERGRRIPMAQVNFIPAGYHTVTPSLVVRGGKRALEFYKQAFGAKELGAMYMPDGEKLMHAELQIGDSRVMLGEESPEL